MSLEASDCHNVLWAHSASQALQAAAAAPSTWRLSEHPISSQWQVCDSQALATYTGLAGRLAVHSSRLQRHLRRCWFGFGLQF